MLRCCCVLFGKGTVCVFPIGSLADVLYVQRIYLAHPTAAKKLVLPKPFLNRMAIGLPAQCLKDTRE